MQESSKDNVELKTTRNTKKGRIRKLKSGGRAYSGKLLASINDDKTVLASNFFGNRKLCSGNAFHVDKKTPNATTTWSFNKLFFIILNSAHS